MRFLRIINKLGLPFILISFGVLVVISADYDPLLKLMTWVKILLGIIWSAYTLFKMLESGKEENVKLNTIKRYNLLLRKPPFLITSTALLYAVLGIIFYELLAFRNVEFIANQNIELFESPESGKRISIGYVPANKITSFRIKTGIRYFLFKNPLKDEFTSVKPTEIPPFWKNETVKRIKLIPDEDFQMLDSK